PRADLKSTSCDASSTAAKSLLATTLLGPCPASTSQAVENACLCCALWSSLRARSSREGDVSACHSVIKLPAAIMAEPATAARRDADGASSINRPAPPASHAQHHTMTTAIPAAANEPARIRIAAAPHQARRARTNAVRILLCGSAPYCASISRLQCEAGCPRKIYRLVHVYSETRCSVPSAWHCARGCSHRFSVL